MAKIDYEKGIHRHWIKVVSQERSDKPDEVVRQIKERFDRGSITEPQLIDWGKEFEHCPHALVEALLYFGIDFD
ncbi:MAG: hypothetical protein GW941_00590 [Candidatus Pacebacteria bacterium]|nr:hypothetical protein [Candidatus Paceibacterota bacterium]